MRLRWTLGLALTAILVLAYTYRLNFLPPHWEEPRRCVVAFEMIANENYVVPTVIGELYAKKPPLLNWLIVALAGFDISRIDVHLIRGISVTATFLCAALLTLFADPRARWPWLAPLIYLTFGIVVQYGRSGEIDPLFVLFTTAALLFFDLGRRRGNPWLQWVPSQAMVAAGFLTKGLSPLFFYPPIVLWWFVERRRRQTPPARGARAAFAVGLFVLFGIVATWLVPYAASGSFQQLMAVSSSEVMARAPGCNKIGGAAEHLATFPFEVVGNLLPWSLLLAALLTRSTRRTVRNLWLESSFFRLAAMAVLWSVVVFWLMPGGKGRYAMPAYPFAAAALAMAIERVATGSAGRRVVGWWALAVIWAAGIWVAASPLAHVQPWLPLIIGLFVICLGGAADLRGWGPSPLVRWLGVLGLLYAVYFASVYEARGIERRRQAVAATGALSAIIAHDAAPDTFAGAQPLVACSPALELDICFDVMKRLQRPLVRPPIARGYVLQLEDEPAPAGGQLLGEELRIQLWRVP
jgi:4-amino-4-deoxy-L-arabinose transferase-like glycosyltransferase